MPNHYIIVYKILQSQQKRSSGLFCCDVNEGSCLLPNPRLRKQQPDPAHGCFAGCGAGGRGCYFSFTLTVITALGLPEMLPSRKTRSFTLPALTFTGTALSLKRMTTLP